MNCLDPELSTLHFESLYSPGPRELRCYAQIFPGTKLSFVFHHFGSPVYLNASGFPWRYRFHVVNRKGHELVAFGYIVVFSSSMKDFLTVTSYPEVLVVVFKSNGYDVWLTFARNCRNPC